MGFFPPGLASVLVLGLALLLLFTVHALASARRGLRALEERLAEAEAGPLAGLGLEGDGEEILRALSHELRTPMNAIVGFSQLLRCTSLSPRQSGYLDRIGAASAALLSRIDDLLVESTIEVGQVSLEARAFELRPLLEGVAAEHSVQASAKGLGFDLGLGENLPGRLRGDAARLRLVLEKLCENAVKYSDRGAVRLGAERLDGAGPLRIAFTVRDSGVGMAEGRIGALFRPFVRGEAAGRGGGGLGLGLSIARNLVLRMGGDIEVESSAGSGSSFRFVLPFEEAGPDEEAVDPGSNLDFGPDPSHLAGISVLLVEDNELNVLVATGMLEAAGASATVAASGEEALRRLAEDDFDIVLMDLQLPGISGFDAAQGIRAMPGKGGVPIVALTANALPQDRERAEAVGMCGYVLKPYRYVDLVRAVASCVDGGSLRAVAGSPREGPPPEVGAPTPASIPPMDGIDVRAGLERTMSDTALYLDVVRMFRTGAARAVAEYRTRAQMGDVEGARRLVHSVKGNAGSIGAVSLHAAAAALEAALRRGGLPAPEGILAAFVVELERVLASTGTVEAGKGSPRREEA